MSISIGCDVESVEPLSDSILKIILKPEHFVDYIAGQYLKIEWGEEALSYSIANAPLGAHRYELHIRHHKDNTEVSHLLAHLKTHGRVHVSLPYGHCHMDVLDKSLPIIFIAGGTGFAPVKAMIEQLLAQGDERSFELFFGARSQIDFYLEDLVGTWKKHAKYFKKPHLLTQRTKKTLADAVVDEHKDLSKLQFVMAGPFEMVYDSRTKLLQHGAKRALMFADAFAFEEQ